MSSNVSGASFVDLLRAELAECGIVPEARSFADDHVIFREGDEGDGLYVIEEGCVRISSVVAQAGRRVLREFGPGEFFGEMAVIDNRTRSGTATCVGACRLSFINSGEMMQIMERSPPLVVTMLREFSQRMRGFNQRFIQEMIEADRLAMFGRFARSIVHDIKNPLYVISLAGDMTAMEKATLEMRRDGRRRIHEQVDRLTSMLNEMLRMTRGPMRHVQEPVDFAAYVVSLCDDVRDSLEVRGVALSLENPPPAAGVKINAQRLNHAFVNLLNNAADAMPGGGSIMLRFEMTPKEVITEIEDTGPGFGEGVAAKLFTPFFTQGKKNGTGLGLSICKNIIEDHGGRVWARDEQGRGAIFCLSLPVDP